jgi:hypothetical protein
MSTGLNKAAGALAAADSVAHIAYLSLFGWRFFARDGIGSYANIIFGALALVGLALGTVGWLLVKTGGRTRVGRLGFWGVALSTALAALLLFIASATS